MCINNCQLIAGSLCPFPSYIHLTRNSLIYEHYCVLYSSIRVYFLIISSREVRQYEHYIHDLIHPPPFSITILKQRNHCHTGNNAIVIKHHCLSVQFLTIGPYLKDHTPRCLMKTIIYLVFRIIGFVPFSAVKKG